MPSYEQLQSNETLIQTIQNSEIDKPVELLFVGDSNIKRHVKLLWEGAPRRFIDARGGLMEVLSDIEEEIHELPKNRYYVVLFNSGLHDLHTLCPATPDQRESRVKYLNASNDKTFNCHDAYASLFRNFTKLILTHIPNAILTVFETTTAAWPKWGLYGAAWNPTAPQVFPRFPQASYEFNRIALEILKDYR